MSLLNEYPGAPRALELALFRAAWPSGDLLAEHVPVVAGRRMLALGSAADPFTLVAAKRAPGGICVVADDDAAACDDLMAQAEIAAISELHCADPMDVDVEDGAQYDLAFSNTLYHSSKRMSAALIHVAHRWIAPGGIYYLAGAKDRGILSIAKEVRAIFGNVTTLAVRKGHRVLAATRDSRPVSDQPPRPQLMPEAATPESVTVGGYALRLLPAPLVFAGGRVDPATALLASALEVRAGDIFVDLGCGAGILGLVAGRRAPGAPIYLLDTSRAAVRAAEANARLNGLADVTALAGDGIALMERRNLRPTVIATNPPFHVGQLATELIARRFIAGAATCLAPGGRLYLVANRFLPYEGELRECFAAVREVAGDARYKVLLAVSPLAAPA